MLGAIIEEVLVRGGDFMYLSKCFIIFKDIWYAFSYCRSVCVGRRPSGINLVLRSSSSYQIDCVIFKVSF